MESHLLKLWKCFEICEVFGININLKKCIFLVFFKMILGFTISKEGKLLDPEKIKAIVNMLSPTQFHDIQVFNGFTQFYYFL